MSRMNWRIAGGATSVVVGCAVGAATNVVTSRWSWSWAWGAGLVGLLLSAVVIQVALTLGERREDAAPQTAPPSVGRNYTVVRDQGVVGNHNVRASITNGVSGLHLVLVLAVIGFFALGVVVWTVPSRGEGVAAAGPGPIASASTTAPGAPLTLSLTGLDNTCHRVLLPETLGDRSRPFTTITAQPTDPDAFMREELAAGGFAYGSVIVRLDAQSPLAQQVTITDVKLVDLTATAPVRGSFVNLDTCGGDEVNAMVIHVNAPDTKPFAVDEESHETDRHFFDTQVVNVSPGRKQSFVVRLVVDSDRTAGAYTFRLALKYEVDGAIRSAVADDHGRPFRLTGGCDFTSANDSAGPTNELVQPVDAKKMAASMCD